MSPTLSIVTGTVGRRDSYFRLLKSIDKHTSVPWELVVSDASPERYSYKSHPNVQTLVERERLGCVKAYNRAFRATTGKWVIFLNDDAEVTFGYAYRAIAFMEAHPEIGLGALYYCEQMPPFKVNEYWGMIYANFGIISRELGQQVGWFDEDLVMYGCDNSLTFRVLLSGFGIASIPGTKVWHHLVLDQNKINNQALRTPDADRLRTKYEPFYAQMMETYLKTKHLTLPLVIGE